MEIDIPDANVLCSDFDEWSIILLNGLLTDSEEEDDRLEGLYNSLSPDKQAEMKSLNWEKVFDLTSVDNEWMRRGESIQAAFWELRKEQVRKVTWFTSAARRPDYIDENGEVIQDKLPKRK